MSISPFGPDEPSWMFMNIKTTATSLSRSNQFNIFVIFFDALIIMIYDMKRPKFVMLTRKCERVTSAVSEEFKKKITRMWKIVSIFGLMCIIVYVSGTLSNFDVVINVVVVISGGVATITVFIIVWHTSVDAAKLLFGFYKNVE
jgi:hypothetical protein